MNNNGSRQLATAASKNGKNRIHMESMTNTTNKNMD